MKIVTDISQTIGYQFQQPTLLQTALTHRSVKGQNNERLEFLGDSILNFIIALALYQKFPQAKEGELSRLRAQLVKGETLSEIAVELSLSQFLLLGQGERKSGGKYRKSILADAVEAIIGAMYLDSQTMTVCQEHVLNWYASRLENLTLKIEKDPKSLLQEYLQAQKMPLPEYQVVAISGEDHEQWFTVHCQVKGLAHQTVGKKTTRRHAEQQAAEQYLQWLTQQQDVK